MSEFTLPPIPTAKDYDDFLVEFDKLVVEAGGALAAVRDYEFRAIHGNEIIFRHIKNTGTVALELEPKNAAGIHIDPLMLSTHAFKRGMLMGFEITSHVYSEHIEPPAINGAIAHGFRHEEISGQSIEELEEIPLLQWGRQGLDMMGEASRRVIRLWAGEITADDLQQRLFGYGVGAVVATAEALKMNQDMNEIDAHFKSPEWYQEIEQILASNTGE